MCQGVYQLHAGQGNAHATIRGHPGHGNAHTTNMCWQAKSTEDDLNEAAHQEFARLRSRSDAELMEASIPQPGAILVATKQKRDIK